MEFEIMQLIILLSLSYLIYYNYINRIKLFQWIHKYRVSDIESDSLGKHN
jgi:hypothetical protein